MKPNGTWRIYLVVPGAICICIRTSKTKILWIISLMSGMVVRNNGVFEAFIHAVFYICIMHTVVVCSKLEVTLRWIQYCSGAFAVEQPPPPLGFLLHPVYNDDLRCLYSIKFIYIHDKTPKRCQHFVPRELHRQYRQPSYLLVNLSFKNSESVHVKYLCYLIQQLCKLKVSMIVLIHFVFSFCTVF